MEEEIQFIERLLKQEKKPKVRDRLRGILLLKKNYTHSEVAEIMGATEQTLYNWKKRYNQSGYECLKIKSIPGRNTILDEEDMKKLKELLQMRDYWTSKEVREVIKNEFDIEFAPRHIPRIPRKLGLKVQLLDIILVFLLPYSPDLNPIEFIWKSIKKELSSRFLMCKEEVRETVECLFYKFSSSLSFAKAWILKFFKPLKISLELNSFSQRL